MSRGLTRRGLLTFVGRAIRRVGRGAPPPAPPPSNGLAGPSTVAAKDLVAVIQGRFCLAYTSFCSVCAERCPVPGAIRLEKGIPMVVPELCDGCAVCHAVCPAPAKAVLLLPRRKIARPATPIPPQVSS